jgi:DNA polymerase III delta prime subunit
MNFIGTTGVIQQTLELKARRLHDTIAAGQPVSVMERRWLFYGPPGNGKTELAKQLAGQLAGSMFEVESRNGTDVSIDVVRSWTDQAQYRPMFGAVSVKFVDEIDDVSTTALTALRTYLDNLANHRIFIAATNRDLDHLQPQLQSRFQAFRFRPINAEEIAAHLAAKYRLDPEAARSIAFKAGGNVRAAEEDAITETDVLALRQSQTALITTL